MYLIPIEITYLDVILFYEMNEMNISGVIA